MDPINIARKFLKYSLYNVSDDLYMDYEDITSRERELCTREEYVEFIHWLENTPISNEPDVTSDIHQIIQDSWDGVEKHTDPLNVQQENEIFRKRLLQYRKRKVRVDYVISKIRGLIYWLFM
jgi:hypothetical protein